MLIQRNRPNRMAASGVCTPWHVVLPRRLNSAVPRGPYQPTKLHGDKCDRICSCDSCSASSATAATIERARTVSKGYATRVPAAVHTNDAVTNAATDDFSEMNCRATTEAPW
mmetsp:Transcript_11446/g.29241  ORF Transcript_11446/g.29241 Transcript_11446/m.29241 type:complete len:112 (-) Transcript_11446:662-997(-)